MSRIFKEENGLYHRLKAKLPFALQENMRKQKLIEKVEVLSIAEWNADPQYGEFPIQPV